MQRLVASVALAYCLLPATARAEAGNQAVEACETLGEGDVCTLKQPSKGPEGVTYEETPGTCQKDECCEQDYSKGSPPEVTCGECLACKAGPPTPPPDAGDAQGEPPKAGDEPPASAGSKRGCTLGGPAPWIALMLLPAGWACGRVSRSTSSRSGRGRGSGPLRR